MKPIKKTIKTPVKRSLTLSELQRIDSLISLAQENGVQLGDAVKVQSEICCCGAITAEAHGKFVINPHDRQLFRQIADLESQIEAAPTLGRLIEVRGELLRAARAK